LDLERLCWRLGTKDIEEIRRNLSVSLAERIARDELKRQPCWTESLAVGSAEFLGKVQPLMVSRRQSEIVEAAEEFWVLREMDIPYRLEMDSKSCRNAE
jgi:hypothetical protein